MITARRDRHRCFQPEPAEVLARWTIEGRVIRDALIIHSSTRHWRLCIDRDLAAGGSFSERVALPSPHSAHALCLSNSQLPQCLGKYEECESMMGRRREMEIKVDEAVLVVH